MGQDLDEIKRLRRARDRMDREFSQPLDVPQLARTALMSPAHFSRHFKQTYAETPYSYLMTRRIERAKALLRQGGLSVTDVCFLVGCTSLGSFSAKFTQIVGQTPSAYRASGTGRVGRLRQTPGAEMAKQRRGPPPPADFGYQWWVPAFQTRHRYPNSRGGTGWIRSSASNRLDHERN